MARPSRNNADYFTHDADFRNDRRIKAIRSEFGIAGYGVVVMLLEILTNADGTQLCTDGVEIDLLAGDLGVSVTEINRLLQLAERIGYFTRNETGHLICPDLNQALEPVFEKRNRSRSVAQIARERQSVTAKPVSVTEIPQSRVEESKVEDTSVSNEDTSSNPTAVRTKGGKMIPPTKEQLTAYVLNREGGTVNMAEEIFDFYKSKGWKVGNQPMKDWNAAANKWVRGNQSPNRVSSTTQPTASAPAPKHLTSIR